MLYPIAFSLLLFLFLSLLMMFVISMINRYPFKKYKIDYIILILWLVYMNLNIILLSCPGTIVLPYTPLLICFFSSYSYLVKYHQAVWCVVCCSFFSCVCGIFYCKHVFYVGCSSDYSFMIYTYIYIFFTQFKIGQFLWFFLCYLLTFIPMLSVSISLLQFCSVLLDFFQLFGGY